MGTLENVSSLPRRWSEKMTAMLSSLNIRSNARKEGEPTGETTFLNVFHAPNPEGLKLEGTLLSLQVGTNHTDCQLWSLESSREVKEGHNIY